MRIPTVMCGKCNAPVKQLASWRHPESPGVYVFEARCHGEIDRCEVDFRKFRTPDDAIVSAQAFQQNKEVTHAA